MLLEDLMLLYYPVNLLRGGVYMNYHPSTGDGWVTLSLWTGRLCLVTQTRRRLPSLEHSYTRPPVSSSVICASERECAVCPLIGSSLISCLSSSVPHHTTVRCCFSFALGFPPASRFPSSLLRNIARNRETDRQKQTIKPTSA